MIDINLNLKKYYIVRTFKLLNRWEIFHKFKGEDSFDGYALTKFGAKYRARKLVLEDFIELLD